MYFFTPLVTAQQLVSLLSVGRLPPSTNRCAVAWHRMLRPPEGRCSSLRRVETTVLPLRVVLSSNESPQGYHPAAPNTSRKHHERQPVHLIETDTVTQEPQEPQENVLHNSNLLLSTVLTSSFHETYTAWAPHQKTNERSNFVTGRI